MTTFKVDEKIELCKELGLENLTSYFNQAKKMMDLNFKEITMDEINRKIHSHVKKTNWYKNRLKMFQKKLIVYPSIFNTVFLILMARFTHNGIGDFQLTAGILIFMGGNMLSIVPHFEGFPFLSINSVPVNNWRYDIPYGALLSMKEAKEKGLSNFEIYYPQEARKEDPILVGKDVDGKMYEIFNWDEGKLYNS